MNRIAIVPVPKTMVYLDGEVAAEDLGNVKVVTVNTLPDGAYELRVDANGTVITSSGAKGEFYARQTLRQISAADIELFPCLLIKDEPRFGRRSFHVDSSRNMQSIDELKKIIDASALLKFNTFHWHLTDDQGFRIQIDRYPLLNSVGSWRDSSDFGSQHTGERYGGFYTKEQIRDIVSYCAERFIDVVPEIDIPGHTTAMISSYPELSCRRLKIPVETKQGIFENILCAGKDDVFDFLFGVLDEILELFPGKYIHIGGDEAPKTRWKACPKCRARMKQLGLENEEQLQSWFTNKVIDYLREHGRSTIVYNESLVGGMLDESATVQLWMDKKDLGVIHANRAGKVIASDFYHTYCDYPYSMTPLKKTYGYNPVHEGIAPVMTDSVDGVEALIWTEYVRDFGKLCYLCFPRFAAVAEIGWSSPERMSETDFEKRYAAIAPLLEKMGIKGAPPEDWNPNPAKRVTDTVGFFSDKIDTATISTALNPDK